MNTIFKTINILIFSAVIFFACNSKSSHDHNHEVVEDENLIEANRFHQASLDLREELLAVEKQLKEANIEYSELKEELKIWDKDIIEVPGFEHSHDDEVQRKYHVHNPMKEFSNEEHKAYQQVMHSEILDLHERFTRKLVPEVMEDSNS
ncbi:hypothetical protein MM213_01710 [Belliella sp. R4-6]|uniref:Lipoprotein n=1 Tax=Belliella alkalica TaxID=1730871 RepID=A0ABS9V737_9BACT|nr:hypothetical protein [Belliella alkalica]MCH7412183.1 hypothetical protein [Belliella alkalica]